MRKKFPHKSHVMTPWQKTIVTITATPRFGKKCKCENCGAAHIKDGFSQVHDSELAEPCKWPQKKSE